jgi:hypothetical protein
VRRKSLLGFLLAVAGVAAAFTLVVLPLFATGPPSGDLTGGNFPSTTKVNQPVTLSIGVDNTGSSTITQVCISASFTPNATPQTVLFQNIDLVHFTGNIACGGALSTGETINVKVTFVPTQLGPLQAKFQLVTGTTPLGSPLLGQITVTQ